MAVPATHQHVRWQSEPGTLSVRFGIRHGVTDRGKHRRPFPGRRTSTELQAYAPSATAHRIWIRSIPGERQTSNYCSLDHRVVLASLLPFRNSLSRTYESYEGKYL